MPENAYENVICEMEAILSLPQCITSVGLISSLSMDESYIPPQTMNSDVYQLHQSDLHDFIYPLNYWVIFYKCDFIFWCCSPYEQ